VLLFITRVAGVVVPVGHPTPLQPVNVEYGAAVAEICTDVPKTYVPAPVTVPVPVLVPAVSVISVNCFSKNVAVHVLSPFMTTLAGLAVLVGQPVPLQPVKLELLAGVAVMGTDVPAL
jgi:hypothetical protein